MSELTSAVPAPTEHGFPYWRGARNHELRFLRCGDCGRWVNYVKLQCPNCGSRALSWNACSGKGRLYSYSILHRASSPAFKEKVPYVLAVIELEGGIKMMSHLINCDLAQVDVDMEVEVVFDDIDDEIAVPYFQPASRR